jgi:hypothetical protein
VATSHGASQVATPPQPRVAARSASQGAAWQKFPAAHSSHSPYAPEYAPHHMPSPQTAFVAQAQGPRARGTAVTMQRVQSAQQEYSARLCPRATRLKAPVGTPAAPSAQVMPSPGPTQQSAASAACAPTAPPALAFSFGEVQPAPLAAGGGAAFIAPTPRARAAARASVSRGAISKLKNLDTPKFS